MFITLLLLLTFAFPAVQAARDPDAVVPASDGVPIYYSVQGTGDTALVFVHCWSCDRSLWKNQVPEFSKKYRVVTIDLPGHGKSGQDRKSWSIESYAEDVKTVVTKLDLKRVVLVGSSMGGPITLEAARRMPDRVVGLAPVDTLHDVEAKVPPEQLDAVVKQLQADYKPAVTGFLNQFFFGPKTPEAVKARIIAETTARPPEPAITILKAIFSYDAAPALREVKVPIRAINANLRPTNLTVNRKYAPQFNVVVMEGLGHYPMLEDPVAFNRHLAEFLQSLPRK
ncbi:MAG TPA: alpha/beta hydrolase [Pyrinomonadaceae bacterium]|nr:alpha/beta hydrolase [Pyrinomonadaceae bacterium]